MNKFDDEVIRLLDILIKNDKKDMETDRKYRDKIHKLYEQKREKLGENEIPVNAVIGAREGNSKKTLD